MTWGWTDDKTFIFFFRWSTIHQAFIILGAVMLTTLILQTPLSHTHQLALHSVSSVSGGVAMALWASAAPCSFGVATAASVAVSPLFCLSAPLSLSFLPSVSLSLSWTSHNTCSSCVPSLSVTAFCSLSPFFLFFVLFLLEFLPPLLSLLYALSTLQSSLCSLGKKQSLKLGGKKKKEGSAWFRLEEVMLTCSSVRGNQYMQGAALVLWNRSSRSFTGGSSGLSGNQRGRECQIKPK